MKTVNVYMVGAMLRPLFLLSDRQEEEIHAQVSPDDEASVKDAIRRLIKPYVDRFDGESYDRAKESLAYFLTFGGVSFERLFFMGSPPFDPPAEPRDFFIWVWEEVFGSEDYEVESKAGYVIDNDVEAPNWIKLL